MTRSRRPAALAAVVTLLAALAVALGGPGRAVPASAAVLPPGFSDARVAAVPGPTAVAQLPDGRLLVTQQAGLLRVVHPDGTLVAAPALDIRSAVCDDFERGLLGVEVDPDVTANGFVYLSYTARVSAGCPRNTAGTPVNRVSRFTLSGDGVVPGSERVLVDGVPSPNGNHNGGDLGFGSDGMLYASFGDGGCSVLSASRCAGANDIARRRDFPLGKVLRITPDGQVPPDNPWAGEAGAVHCTRPGAVRLGSGPCAETWLWGLRNPFRFAVEASSGQMFVNDVGQNAHEEVDLARAGADYGWNVREGACPTGSTTGCGESSFEDPIVSYPHSSGCQSITGGAFAPPSWPAPHASAYLYADYVCGRIFSRPASGGASSTLVSGLGGSSAVHLETARWGGRDALLYTTYADGGEVRALVPSGNSGPSAALTATPASGAPPLTVRLDAGGSRDPDGDDLTYRFEPGDGSPPVTSSSPVRDHEYRTTGSFEARVTVTDSRGATATATTGVTVGAAAPGLLVTASPAAPYAVGTPVEVRVRSTEPGVPDPSGDDVRWTALLHHDGHTHPLASGTGSTLTLPYPAPEDLRAAETSYVTATTTVSGEDGGERTATLRLDPAAQPVTLRAFPPGVQVQVAGERLALPATVTGWTGWAPALDVAVQDVDGRLFAPVRTACTAGGPAFRMTVGPGPTTCVVSLRSRALRHG